jgi:hypothetical protein
MVVNHRRQAQSGLHKIISAIDVSVSRWLGSASKTTASSALTRPNANFCKSRRFVWQHFVVLMEALPAEQAAPLWQRAAFHMPPSSPPLVCVSWAACLAGLQIIFATYGRGGLAAVIPIAKLVIDSDQQREVGAKPATAPSANPGSERRNGRSGGRPRLLVSTEKLEAQLIVVCRPPVIPKSED